MEGWVRETDGMERWEGKGKNGARESDGQRGRSRNGRKPQDSVVRSKSPTDIGSDAAICVSNALVFTNSGNHYLPIPVMWSETVGLRTRPVLDQKNRSWSCSPGVVL